MNYTLNTQKNTKETKSFFGTLKALRPLVQGQEKQLVVACIATIINSILVLAVPLVIGRAVDTYIAHKDMHDVWLTAGILLFMYICALGTSYLQTTLMGRVGQQLLYRLRNSIFDTLQSLPVAFFNQNKAGDLISRINNDTEKLNMFFSQSLVQFMSSIFVMVGAGIAVLCINFKLGIFVLVPAVAIFLLTSALRTWVEVRNAKSLASVGNLSAEIAESIENFKVVVASNRQDYFIEKFDSVNSENYKNAVSAGIANNIFIPLYGLAANISQIVVLGYGIYLISIGQFSVGLLVSFFSYAMNFYNPLRQLAALWSNFQVALAGWNRVSAILAMKSDLEILPHEGEIKTAAPLLEFKDVAFTYPEGKIVIRDANFALQEGRVYALVGPTGGGKTTTASLMARLFDPTSGSIYFKGRDIRSLGALERTNSIGFILQEPFLFAGTIGSNITYGNDILADISEKDLAQKIQDAGLGELIASFEDGLATTITNASESISLGQKQIISFVRALLRKPELLILDEATANIDTMTEDLLQKILQQLPKTTTRVVIAHRLHTIANADDIFFVNNGEIIHAGDMAHAMDMLLHNKRKS